MQGPSQSGNGGGGGRSGSADIQLGSSDAWSAVKAKRLSSRRFRR